ncbi:C45 family peptidase [Marinitoga sp. 1138]|uniref:C45 family autoproteolytic acyltransferase/hydolase n=1 Tax=Marinitoga sp. 1138 TaxID=1643334 RepID=UPI0015866D3D|nr:C45 family peptidase [Marinitoga sp. 1138]NUU97459.1 hypothetical protein [Marinitoga sp. 1138]
MKKFLYSLFIVFFITLLYIVYIFTPLKYPIKNITTAEYKTEKIGNLKILYLSGEPQDIGYQHGLALRNEINNMEKLLENELKNKTIFEKLIIRYTMKNYFRKIPKEYKTEMAAIAKGSNTSLDSIFLMNIYDELFNLYGCTNIAVFGKKTKNGEILHGRNLDYFLSDKLWDKNVLFVYQPQNGYNFISLTWPGLIGVLSGMNERGISLGSMTSESKYQSSSGIPTGILYRMIMENAKDIKDVEVILKNNKRTIGNNLMIGSKHDKEAVVFEFDSNNLKVRKNDNYIVSTNHFVLLKNKNGIYKGSISRKNKAENYIKSYNYLTVKNIIEILRDLIANNENDEPICKYETVHSIVFLPISSEFYVAANDGIYASAGRFFHFKYDKKIIQYIDYIDYSPDYLWLTKNLFIEKYKNKEWSNQKAISYIKSFIKNRKLSGWDIIDLIKFYKELDLKNETSSLIEKLKSIFEKDKNALFNLPAEKINSPETFLLRDHYNNSLLNLILAYEIIDNKQKMKEYSKLGLNDNVIEDDKWYSMKFKEYYNK